MTRVLVDTSAYSALLRGSPAAAKALRGAEAVCVNPVILGELLSGFLQGKYRKKNEAELRLFLSSPRVSILSMTQTTAEHYALILNSLRRRGTPIPTNDVWIAATAMEHGLKVLTLDTHFQKVIRIQVDLVASE